MARENQFSEVITTEAQLREIIGYPHDVVVRKTISVLDDYCREYIAKSPFLLIASSDARGSVDVSPKGDPAGFVQVYDERTLLIPHRPGNNRADTFRNVLQNPKVGLLFLIPGKRETLRISGQASIIRDTHLREQMAVKGKLPELLLAVSVEEAFFHCAKCIIRSALWNANSSPDLDGLASLAETMVKHGKLDVTVEALQADITDDEKTNLY